MRQTQEEREKEQHEAAALAFSVLARQVHTSQNWNIPVSLEKFIFSNIYKKISRKWGFKAEKQSEKNWENYRHFGVISPQKERGAY